MNIFFGKMGSCNRFHSHPGSFKLAFCYSIYRREMTMFVRSRWQKTAADDVCRRRRRGILIMGIVFRRPRAASTASPLDNQRSKRQSRLQSASVSDRADLYQVWTRYKGYSLQTGSQERSFCHLKMETFLKTSSHAEQSDQFDCLF